MWNCKIYSLTAGIFIALWWAMRSAAWAKRALLLKLAQPVDKLKIAYASCQRWEAGYFTAYKHMLAEKPDAVLFLGDYIYEYPGNPVSAVRVPSATSSLGFVLTLDDYRNRYAQYKSDADLQAMHAACPWLMTWDDHEVQNDYAGLTGGTAESPIFSPTLRTLPCAARLRTKRITRTCRFGLPP